MEWGKASRKMRIGIRKIVVDRGGLRGIREMGMEAEWIRGNQESHYQEEEHVLFVGKSVPSIS